MATGSQRATLRIIQKLPDEASLEEIMYKLHVRQRINRDLRELSAAGRRVSHAEAKRSVAKWLRSAGR